MKAILIAHAAAGLIVLSAAVAPAAQAADPVCASVSTATTEQTAESCAIRALDEDGSTLAVDALGDAASVALPDERYRHWGDEFLACLLNGLQQGLPFKQTRKECGQALKPPGGEGAGDPGFGPLPPGFDFSRDEIFDPSVDEISDPTAAGEPSQNRDSEWRESESSQAQRTESFENEREGPNANGSAASCSAGDPGISGWAGAERVGGYGWFSWGRSGLGNGGLSYGKASQAKAEAIAAYKDQLAVAEAAVAEFDRLEAEAEAAAQEAAEIKSHTNNPTDIRAAEQEAKQAEKDAIEAARQAVAEVQKAAEAKKKADADPNQTSAKQGSKKSTSQEPSDCKQGIQALRDLMWECHRTNGRYSGCQELEAKLHNCPDQTTINVDPEQGHSCRLDVDMKALAEAWVARCEELMDPGPDGHPCEPPAPPAGSHPEQAGDPNDMCRNPLAYVEPGSEECLPTGVIGDFGMPNMRALMIWAYKKFGLPIIDVPTDDSTPPAPPGPGPDPHPGSATSSPD